jgi:hypothetical protein
MWQMLCFSSASTRPPPHALSTSFAICHSFVTTVHEAQGGEEDWTGRG